MSTRASDRALLLLVAIIVLAGATLLLLVSVVFVSPERTSDYFNPLPTAARVAQGIVAFGCFGAAAAAVGIAAADLRRGNRTGVAGRCVAAAFVLGVAWIVIVASFPSPG